jgi:hypothetical protein
LVIAAAFAMFGSFALPSIRLAVLWSAVIMNARVHPKLRFLNESYSKVAIHCKFFSVCRAMCAIYLDH